jgi:hypothetical protein
MTCRCATVYVGTTVVGKNWHPDCQEHPWDERLQAQADRSVELQLQAREARRKARMTTKQVEVPDNELAEQIAVGMHTGLRKGSEAPSSHKLWKAISTSDDSAWSDAAAFCVYGLKSMGYKITKAES